MTEYVFRRELVVHVKQTGVEDRSANLLLTIEIHTESNTQNKYLQVQLTSGEDNFFLFSLKIDEDDFRKLKDGQGLLVHFPMFPKKLTELLEMCLSEQNKEIPKFILQFMKVDTHNLLNIVETNPFKHLIHLSLKLTPGNDFTIKSYLSTCLNDCKAKNEVLRNRLESTESSLRKSLKATEEALSQRTQELNKMKLEWENRMSELNAKTAQSVTQEKQEHFRLQTSIQQRYQLEKKDLEQAHLKIVKQLEARIYEIDTQNKELTETKFLNDASIRDLTSKLSISENEVKKLRSDVETCRQESNSTETDIRKQEKTIHSMKTQIAVLETQVADKELLNNRNNQQLQTEQQHRKQLEIDLSSLRDKKSQLDSSVKTLSDEILKANEIIRKLQQDNKQTHSKMKLRSQITIKQEEVLKDKENQLEREKTVHKQLLTEHSQLIKQHDELSSKLSKKEEELTECLQKNASNENVISWLNKQLDQVQTGRPLRSSGPVTGTGCQPYSSTGMNSQPSYTNTASHGVLQPSTISAPNRLMSSGGSVDKEEASVSKIPQPIHKSTPLTAAFTTGNQENVTPILNTLAVDAKYLPVNPPPAPLRPKNSYNHPQMNIPGVKTRIGKDVVNAGKPLPLGNPLATAYFTHSQK